MKDEHAVILGSRGGKASAAKLSKAQRKQRAKHASQQRKIISRKKTGAQE